jgi:hypothetical protein
MDEGGNVFGTLQRSRRRLKLWKLTEMKSRLQGVLKYREVALDAPPSAGRTLNLPSELPFPCIEVHKKIPWRPFSPPRKSENPNII